MTKQPQGVTSLSVRPNCQLNWVLNTRASQHSRARHNSAQHINIVVHDVCSVPDDSSIVQWCLSVRWATFRSMRAMIKIVIGSQQPLCLHWCFCTLCWTAGSHSCAVLWLSLGVVLWRAIHNRKDLPRTDSIQLVLTWSKRRPLSSVSWCMVIDGKGKLTLELQSIFGSRFVLTSYIYVLSWAELSCVSFNF